MTIFFVSPKSDKSEIGHKLIVEHDNQRAQKVKAAKTFGEQYIGFFYTNASSFKLFPNACCVVILVGL